MMILNYEKVSNFLYNKLVCFVSSNSLWIYLWHILFMFFTDNINNTVVRFMVVLIGSCTFTFVQSIIVRFAENKFGKNEIIKVFQEQETPDIGAKSNSTNRKINMSPVKTGSRIEEYFCI